MRINSWLKIGLATQIIVTLFFLSFTGAYAKSGCCSHHKGVAHINGQVSCASNGKTLCNDGYESTCPCNGSTSAPTKHPVEPVNPYQQKTTTTAPTTNTPVPMHSRGCCKGHNGVIGCASNGHLQCGDKTTSPTCLCNTSGASSPSTAEPSKATTKAPTTSPVVAPVKLKKGCCKGHQGVSKCDQTTGYKAICVDGTTSPTCGCR